MSSHIIVCPTAFKGTISAAAATRAMARGAAEAIGVSLADVIPIPLSDGGNGLLDAARHAGGGEIRVARVPGPDGRFVEARYLVQNHQVVVETAQACGLHLVAEAGRDPLLATTAGVGALLREAAAALPGSHAELVVGLGGSATVDAGAGMATALGWSLLDPEGEPILPCASGLLRLARISGHPHRMLPRRLRVLADVTNPLLGPSGAVRVFAPQKGASPRDLPVLERALTRWADVARRTTGVDVAALPGAGAAGGLGAAFAALFGANPERGADWMLETVAFDRRLRSARAVVTGEGEWDAQSSMGKVTGEVLARARAAGVPALLVVGRVSARVPAGVALRGGTGRTTGTLDAAALARHVREGLNGLLGRRGRP